jgi:deazaflavin-dependent oxidoreductase (nitroreductase family)
MKKIFQFFLSIHVFLYRLTEGRFGSRVQGLNVLLLTTTGRKSSKRRTIPLGYFMDGDSYVVIASNAGFDTHPAWFHNLMKTPWVGLEVEERKLPAIAEVINSEKRNALWAKLVQLAPGYANYEKKTDRTIPLVALRPLLSQ